MIIPGTPIENSIQDLQEHMTPVQNKQLAAALMLGEKYRGQVERIKKERWKYGSSTSYQFKWKYFTQLKCSWEETNKTELKKIGYHTRSSSVRNRFVEEFIEDYIIYGEDIWPTRTGSNVVGYKQVLDHLKEGISEGDALRVKKTKGFPDIASKVAELFIKQGGLKNGVHISFEEQHIGDEGIIAMSNMLEQTGGLRSGSSFDMSLNQITDYGIGYLANALEKTGGLRKGVTLDIGGNQFTDQGIELISSAIEKTGGLREGVTLEFEYLSQTSEGIKALMNAINNTGGLKEGVQLFLADSRMGDEGVRLIAEMIKKSGGLKRAVSLDLRENTLTPMSIEYMLEAIESTGGIPAGASLDMSQESYGSLLPGVQERIDALNDNDVDNQKFIILS